MFEDLAARKGSGTVYDEFSPLMEQDREYLEQNRSRLPEDYVDFLLQIGWGDLSSRLMIYSGPLRPEEIYGNRPDLPVDMMMFGDDYSGHCFGFYRSDSNVHQIEPGTMVIRSLGTSFAVFIRDLIARASI